MNAVPYIGFQAGAYLLCHIDDERPALFLYECDDLPSRLISMFKNYLRISIRILIRQKGYTFIKILGLAAGIAYCLLIVLYVLDELSYDRFHQ